MKKLSCLLALLLGLFTFIACGGDEEDEEDNNPTTSGTMTAKIDGRNWTGKDIGTVLLNGRFTVGGIADNKETITLNTGTFAKKTYNLDENSVFDVATYQLDNLGTQPAYTTNYDNGSGNITITDINTTDSLVSGTFSFKAVRAIDNKTINITEGKFTNVPFKNGLQPISGNTLKVKVDGQDFTPTFVAGLVYQGQLTLTASDAAGKRTVGFYLPSNITTGTYTLGDPFGSDYGAQYNKDDQTFLTADSGTLKITQHNTSTKTISGTFDFKASEFGGGSATANLTAGSFTVKYN